MQKYRDISLKGGFLPHATLRFTARWINCSILLSYFKITARKAIMCDRYLKVPNRSRINETIRGGGTIKGTHWYGLGTPAPKSYHSLLFFN